MMGMYDGLPRTSGPLKMRVFRKPYLRASTEIEHVCAVQCIDDRPLCIARLRKLAQCDKRLLVDGTVIAPVVDGMCSLKILENNVIEQYARVPTSLGAHRNEDRRETPNYNSAIKM